MSWMGRAAHSVPILSRIIPTVRLTDTAQIVSYLINVFCVLSHLSFLLTCSSLLCIVLGSETKEQVAALELYFENVQDQEGEAISMTWYID